ncbi:hypothetical protein EW146_g1234 [Bondarzewia mesenterica]|uniref:Post-GPI attachment to proteins factor 3 n=1 Tax=Bondarzewia mesenterica TaxID=1095465 RepID=A0A4S4M4L7_9AGAM|nr:hypothetical protein EW146_g1234 [Bondarzewia mesenterica]
MQLQPYLRFLTLASILTLVAASSGDRSNDFQRCVSRCQLENCTSRSEITQTSLLDSLTHWTCIDQCKYKCMHTITDFAIEIGVFIQQYYGKWPFWRFLGMQEPASVIFSLMNLLLHIWGRGEVEKDIQDDHPMKKFYVTWSYVSCNAWLWSAVFHTRDTPLTEKLDYFSAAMTILYSLYFSVIRLFHLYPVNSRNRHLTSPIFNANRRRIMYYLWSILCILVYIGHVSYLVLLPRFDYTYNIIFNLALGLTHNILWLAFALPSSLSVFRRFAYQAKSYRPVYATNAAVAVLLTTAATCLELF